MEKPQTIHERLKAARQQKYKSAYEFATSQDIPAGTYGAHENGSRGISVYTANRYARMLNVNATWLLTGEGEMEPLGFSENPSQGFSFGRHNVPGRVQEKKRVPKKERESLKKAMSLAKEMIEKHHGSASIEDITELAFRMLELAEKWDLSDDKINAEMADWLMTWMDE